MNSSNRDPGHLIMSSNIERQIKAPLDASMLVRTASALTDPNTFKSINDDGNDYSFPGMIVAVINDVDEYKNGLYILKNLPRVNPDNWVQFQPAYDNRLKTKSSHVISAINDLYNNAAMITSDGGIMLPVYGEDGTFKNKYKKLKLIEKNNAITIEIA